MVAQSLTDLAYLLVGLAFAFTFVWGFAFGLGRGIGVTLGQRRPEKAAEIQADAEDVFRQRLNAVAIIRMAMRK